MINENEFEDEKLEMQSEPKSVIESASKWLSKTYPADANFK